MLLSKFNLKNVNAGEVSVPEESLFALPEKVLQFGTGVLLRGLPDYFIDKANKHFGSITQLERKEFDTSNVCFDFWVVKPNDHALYKTYENAIDILSSLTSKHRIIEEEKDFERYIEEALDTVKLIDLNIFAKEEQKSIEDN